MARRRKVTTDAAPLPPAADAYGEVVEAYRALFKQILVGVSTPKDRADLDVARQRAQTLKDAYPTLWEKACHEVDK